MEAIPLTDEPPATQPADSPQRHDSAPVNAGRSSGAGASDVWDGWTKHADGTYTRPLHPETLDACRAFAPFGAQR